MAKIIQRRVAGMTPSRQNVYPLNANGFILARTS
jgi:hypothetical protein